MEITDRVTVLRDGKKAGSSKTKETDLSNLIHLIVGEKKTVDNASSPLKENKVNSSDEKVLEVRNFTNDRVKNVNLTLRKGEILGLVGGIGSGRTELLESLFGIRKINNGEILLDGELIKIRNIQDSIHAGIKLVPEDRHKFGLILEHDIEHNNAMTMAETLRRNLLIFSHIRSRKYAEDAVNKLSIKASSIFNFMSELSGGNQQKVVLGKWLHANTKVLLLDEPTAGVDVGARAEIYEIIRQLASQGTAILICSSDFDEMFQLCSSFAFIRDGDVSQVFESSLIKTENDLHAKLENREWESSNV
jgi:ribose transport system ATP-binding protein